MTSDGIAQYSQPSFYRFSDDSTALALFASSTYPICEGARILDLCAGCGVVGLEILSRSEVSLSLTSVEIEQDYIEHFNSNVDHLDTDHHSVEFICSDLTHFSKRSEAQSYELIVCNPPYFDAESNRSSLNSKKAICRTIGELERKSLVKAVERLLAKNGVCLVVVRKGESLLTDFFESRKLICRVVKEMGKVLLVEALLNIN
ncbi:MAG: RsmD family RNA methyltransferase [Bacteriovoracaceae bacterium]|nr:RsmD family RNA methyltransferase [Bacteriovoracaceae bacterium]